MKPTAMTCDLCEHVAEGETFEAWMQALMPHYLEAHKDVMEDPSKGEKDKQVWMNEQRERFNQQ